jgi:enoyl-CoA hydratase
MTDHVHFETRDDLACIALDDGRVNALSPSLQAELGRALDAALETGLPLVLRGRPGVFSAGFDLKVLAAGDAAARDMLIGGFQLARRLAAWPTPVLAACTGHAIAMGAFLLLAADLRIGVRGEFRTSANEVAIGLTMPRAATALLRHRLTPSSLQTAAVLAETFDPDRAVAAGFLDEVVDPAAFDARVDERAAGLRNLDPAAHRATKERLRGPWLEALDGAIEQDRHELGARAAASTAG